MMDAESIKNKIAMAIDKINSLKSELAEKKEEVEMLNEDVESLTNENNDLKSQISSMENDKDRMLENNSKVKKEIEDKLNDLNELFDGSELGLIADQESPADENIAEDDTEKEIFENTEKLDELLT